MQCRVRNSLREKNVKKRNSLRDLLRTDWESGQVIPQSSGASVSKLALFF